MNLNDYNIKVIASNVRDERLRNLLERYDDRIIVKSDNIAFICHGDLLRF